ncbi:MAG: hypothetical protein FWH41_08525 [Treponema sp.]|nr:hypothetical protein [Treponema sp.]
MMKKQTVLALLFAAFCSFAAQGQEAQKNLVAFGINFSDEFPFYKTLIRPGLSLEYERLLNGYVSIGLEIGTNMTIWPYFEMQARWYPKAQKFFAGLKFGTLCVWGSRPGRSPFLFPVFSPEIGWKFGIGKAGRNAIIVSLADRMNFSTLPTNILELCIKIGKKF